MVRKTFIICLEIFLGISVVLGLLGVVSAWRLSQGPVSIKFLLPYAEDLLHRSEATVHAEVDDLILTWAGWERALDLRALNVQLNAETGGRRLAFIREVSFTLSARALIRGKVTPTSLEVIRPLIRLSRRDDGTFRFGMGEHNSTAENSDGKLFTELLDEMSLPPNSEGRLRHLNRISVIGARLLVEDRELDITWGAEQSNINIERAPNGLRASFNLTGDFTTFKPDLSGEAYYDRGSNKIDISTNFKNLNPRKLAERFAAMSKLRALDTNISGAIQARVGLDGTIEHAGFKLDSAFGSIRITGIDAPSIEFRKITAEGRLVRAPDKLQITSLTANFADGTAEVKGLITRIGDIAVIDARLQIPNFPINALHKFWLPGIAEDSRRWVLTNIRNGSITSASTSLRARIALDGEDKGSVDVESIDGRFTIADSTIHYLAPMPPITNTTATGSFSKKRLNFVVHRGRVGELPIEEGTVDIRNIGTPRAVVSVSALVRGGVKPAIELIAHPRLNMRRRLGFSTEDITGIQATRLQIDVPLLKELKADDVSVSAVSNIEDLSVKSVLRGKGINNGRVALKYNNESLTASGNAVYADTSISFKWMEDFSNSRSIKRRIEAGLTAKTRIAKIFDLHYPGILDGPVPLNLVYEQQQNNNAELSASLDLQDAKLFVPGFDWVKLPGRPGNARLSASFRNGSITNINQFNIKSGTFSTLGNVAFAPRDNEEGRPISKLRLDNFKLGPTEFSADIVRRKFRGYDIKVKGPGLDASPFLSKSIEDFDNPNLPAFRLTGKLKKLWIGPSAPTSNVGLELHYDGKHWQHINVAGALPDGDKAIEIRMLPNVEGHVLALYSADAGVFLRALDITDTIIGGTIEIAGTRKGNPDAPWTGTAEMKRFGVANAPGIARLFTIASLTGIGNLVAGRGIQFKQVRLPFVFAENTAIIKDAQGVGSELGITASGKIDFGTDTIDINGTIVPAYTLNSLLGKIPIIGTILSGEKGGGVFASSYKVSGPVENPKISVNPLSALAPGFLRKLMQGVEGINEGKTPAQEESLEKDGPLNRTTSQ